MPSGDEVAAAECRRVRRVRLDVDFDVVGFDADEAVRCVLALFPRARYASWGAGEVPDVQLLPQPD
jgi:hypothetical protein